MSGLPYFPLYPTDFEADTSHLTLEEDGAYNRLLRLMWMTPGCSLPDDEAWIRRRMRVSQEDFDRVVRVVLDEFFTRKRGRICNQRLAKEYAKSSVAHRKRVEAGSKGGTAKALKEKKKTPSKAKAMLYQPEPEPEPDIEANASISFDDFWDVVPKRVGRGAAEKAFAKAIRIEDPRKIIDAMRVYASIREGKDPQFTCQPATWLNQKRWTDEHHSRSTADVCADIAAEFEQERVDPRPGQGSVVALPVPRIRSGP